MSSAQETVEKVEDLVRQAAGDAPDPYGWIAAVEADRPTVENSQGEQVQVRAEHVVVWPHTLDQPEKFDHAVAKVLPNGTLLVMRPGSEVPLKGYAPGAWLTFEHVGEQYHTHSVQTRPVARKPEPVPPAEYRKGGYAADPMRRVPPTLDQDANEDTQEISAVAVSDATEGGGVAGPKAPGARADAGRTGRTPRPATAAPEDDEPTPGRLRSLWHALRNPDWAED